MLCAAFTARPGCRGRVVYRDRGVDWMRKRPRAGRGRYEFITAATRKFTRAVYRAVRLFAGDVGFDGVGMLQAGEFDGKAILDMANHPARRLADGNRRADVGPQFG